MSNRPFFGRIPGRTRRSGQNGYRMYLKILRCRLFLRHSDNRKDGAAMHIRMFVFPGQEDRQDDHRRQSRAAPGSHGPACPVHRRQPRFGVMRAIFSGDFDRAQCARCPDRTCRPLFSGFSLESASFDWVLIDAPSRLPAAELIPPKAQFGRLHGCVDIQPVASGGFPGQSGGIAEESQFRCAPAAVEPCEPAFRNPAKPRTAPAPARRSPNAGNGSLAGRTLCIASRLAAGGAFWNTAVPQPCPVGARMASGDGGPKIAFGNNLDECPACPQIDRLQLPADSIPRISQLLFRPAFRLPLHRALWLPPVKTCWILCFERRSCAAAFTAWRSPTLRVFCFRRFPSRWITTNWARSSRP